MFLPPSTNHQYRGHVLAAYLIGLTGLFMLGPGAIHYFAPDGGAVSIAERELGEQENLIIGIFAWVGATQMVWGAVLLAVAVRYRNFLQGAAALVVVEQTLHGLSYWVFRGFEAPPPPAVFKPFIFVPLALLAIFLARSRD